VDGNGVSPAPYFTHGFGHFPQGLDGRLGLALLDDPQRRVQHNHDKDNDHVGVFAEYARDDTGPGQNQDHGVPDLSPDP